MTYVPRIAVVLTLALAAAGVAQPSAFAEGPESGGTHLRLDTGRGPVHVWIPAGFDPRTAGVVVYVHGYFTAIDQAWQEHRLAEQFRDSGLNALFIAPVAPASIPDPVAWPNLGALVEAVRARLAPTLVDGFPRGPWVVAGHSGAFRTIAGWLGDPRVRRLVLLDALYRNESEFAQWLRGGTRTASRQMVLVALETLAKAERFVRGFHHAVRRETIPETPAELSATERKARLLYFKSQYDHMELVTGGHVLPTLLRLAASPVIPDAGPVNSAAR